VCREELLVRRTPRDLLHAYADAGVLALELRNELRDLLALRPHRPEPDRYLTRPLGAPACGANGGEEDGVAQGHCARNSGHLPRLPEWARLRPQDDHATGCVRPCVLAGDLSGAAIDFDPVHVTDGRVLMEGLDFHTIDPPRWLTLWRPGHEGEALEPLLVALDLDASNGSQGIADRTIAFFLELFPSEVSTKLALPPPFELDISRHELLCPRSRDLLR